MSRRSLLIKTWKSGFFPKEPVCQSAVDVETKYHKVFVVMEKSFLLLGFTVLLLKSFL